MREAMRFEPFGEKIPFCEPYWYQGGPSPYYKESHRKFRDELRAWLQENVTPHCEKWIASEKGYPTSLHRAFYEAGFGGAIFPAEYGGTPPADFDAFHEVILWYELGYSVPGAVLGQLAINSMALPPILKFGSEYLKQLLVRDVITGRSMLSLAISEPEAGSDVANVQADVMVVVVCGSRSRVAIEVDCGSAETEMEMGVGRGWGLGFE